MLQHCAVFLWPIASLCSIVTKWWRRRGVELREGILILESFLWESNFWKIPLYAAVDSKPWLRKWCRRHSLTIKELLLIYLHYHILLLRAQWWKESFQSYPPTKKFKYSTQVKKEYLKFCYFCINYTCWLSHWFFCWYLWSLISVLICMIICVMKWLHMIINILKSIKNLRL